MDKEKLEENNLATLLNKWVPDSNEDFSKLIRRVNVEEMFVKNPDYKENKSQS
jgi:hypothetical protein